MKKRLLCWEVGVFILANVLLFVLHEAYKQTGIWPLSLISAVNESVWEHIKITYFALLISYIIEAFFIAKHYSNFWFAKAMALITGPLFLLISYYTYTGILGDHILIVDIILGILSILAAQIVSCSLMKACKDYSKCNPIWIGIIIALTFVFIIFTYYPPKIDLFRDSITGEYGIH